MLLFHMKKIHVLNFHCSTEQQNFITHKIFQILVYVYERSLAAYSQFYDSHIRIINIKE